MADIPTHDPDDPLPADADMPPGDGAPDDLALVLEGELAGVL